MRRLLKPLILLLVEAIVVAVVLLVLPRFGIHLHWGISAAIIIAVGLIVYVAYGSVTTIARRRPAGGIESLIGARGRVITPLTPEGSIRISGETWKASALDCEISIGQEVVVMRCQGLTLVVEPANSGDES